MSHTLVSDCSKCKSICCKHGPGPHKKLTPEEYLGSFGELEAYNTQCMALTEDNKCSLWGTPNLPQECRVYVCQSKVYTDAQLKKISSVLERECPNCKSAWMLGTDNKAGWKDTCEICGYEQQWSHSTKKKGNQKMKDNSFI
jgi:hypothetical protein